jgi:hypothetical protein
LREALDALRVKKSEVLVLPTARAVIARSPIIAQNHTRDAIDRAVKFVASVAVITDPDVADFALLTGVPGIDVGEATLFAGTKGLADFLVATGDKRSLRALTACPACGAIHTRLQSRVICLEQVMVLLIKELGYKNVQRKVGRCVGDACIEHAFAGGRLSQPEADCLQWLNHYIAELRGDTGTLLVP